jgi:anti-sigma regulatory factor (Ser/Thr protein kinase)
MIVTLSLVLPGEATSVRVARRMLASTLDVMGVARDTAFEMCLALTEACTNVVDHSHAEDGYEVVVEISADTCRMTVTDTGRGFQPHLFDGGAGDRSEMGGTLAAEVFGDPAGPGAAQDGTTADPDGDVDPASGGASAGATAVETAVADPAVSDPAVSETAAAETALDETVVADPAAEPPDTEGGRGIPLIRALTDRFGISSGPGEGVIVFLERRLQGDHDDDRHDDRVEPAAVDASAPAPGQPSRPS